MFSNAGIGGGPSFVESGREEWERTFAVNWWGVYHCARTFLPLLIASGDGVLVNTSSVNGFWAALGPGMPNSAYATAKFAIRGFTEALIEDLRTNAPQVRVALVMPGHVGTDILANSRRAQGRPEPQDISDTEIREMIPADAQEGLIRAGILRQGASPDDLRRLLAQFERDFREKAPVTAAAAATTILDGVRSGTWRILIGQDAATLDSVIRANPEAAYDYDGAVQACEGRGGAYCEHRVGIRTATGTQLLTLESDTRQYSAAVTNAVRSTAGHAPMTSPKRCDSANASNPAIVSTLPFHARRVATKSRCR